MERGNHVVVAYLAKNSNHYSRISSFTRAVRTSYGIYRWGNFSMALLRLLLTNEFQVATCAIFNLLEGEEM